MASQQYSVNLGLDIVPISKDPEVLSDMYRVYNAIKLVMQALDTYTGALGAQYSDWSTTGSNMIALQNMCRHYASAAVNITPGQLVGLNASGAIVLATPGTCIGWAPNAITAGNYGEIKLLGLHTAITGLTPGVQYYVSSTPGGITSTVTAQKAGKALAANRLFFNPS